MSFAHGKIQPPLPRRGVLLSRPALEGRLIEALRGHRAVLLSAPAGCGKTALLVRALTQLPAGYGVVWVTLDPGDDLHRLLECLVAALEPFDPPWRVAPEGLIAAALEGDQRGRQQAVDDLVNALEACELAHGVIALDDLHYLDDTASQHFLERLLERLGPRWTLVLATRHGPALNLARLRAAGELAQLTQADLRFTRDEALALFADAGIEAATAAALHERTDGWAAGLRLALTGARGGSPGSAIDRQAFDFLANEVLARIDPDLRHFLLHTSVLHELDAARCTALTGDARAALWLDEIERLGLFATVTDAATLTLRLHDLFRDALRHRLRIEQPEAWLALLARAAAREADPLRRQALWLDAQHYDDAASDLHRIAWPLMFQGGVQTVLRLVEQFPAVVAQASAELQQVAGLAKWHVWRARDAEHHLANAQSLYAARGDLDNAQTARGQCAVILVAMGRLEAADRLLAPLREARVGGKARVLLLVCDTWLAMESSAFRSVAARFDALLDALLAENTLEYWTLVVPSPRLTACPAVSPLLGRWADGVLAVTGEQPLPLHTLALVTRGWQALWRGDVSQATEQLRRADAAAHWTGQHVIARSHSQALRALLDALRGEAAEALSTSRQRIDEFPGSYGDWGLWHMQFFACRIAAACSDPVSLREGLQRLARLESALPEPTPARLRPLVGLRGTLAWLEGRRGEALALWRAALEHEEQTDLIGQAHELRTRLAWAALSERAIADAAQWLAPILDRAEDGPRGALFARQALVELAAVDWREHLGPARLATLRQWVAGLAPPAVAPALQCDEGLTARELEVLALIARGQSNKLIARALELSPHTVKRHVANVLGKLALASRSQAAAWYHTQGASRSA